MCTWICTCTVFNANNFCWRRRLLLLSPLSANFQLWWSHGKWCGSSALQPFFRHQLAGVGIQLLLLLQLFAHFIIFLSELWKFVFFSQQNCFHYSSKLLSLIDYPNTFVWPYGFGRWTSWALLSVGCRLSSEHSIWN